MKALILAAGFGTRMRPLTEHLPKPLLKAGGIPLIEHTIKALRTAGVTELVINHAWLGQKIEATLGDGRRLGVTIQYSAEGEPLGTAGGIRKALPLLTNNGEELLSPFIVVNGDIWTDYEFNQLTMLTMPQNMLAHLVMVNNPDHNPEGDFIALDDKASGASGQTAKETSSLLLEAKQVEAKQVEAKHLQTKQLQAKSPHAKGTATDRQTLTYSGIGLYRPELFKDVPAGTHALAPLLINAMLEKRISGEKFTGKWNDIGTPKKLAWLDQHLGGCATG